MLNSNSSGKIPENGATSLEPSFAKAKINTFHEGASLLPLGLQNIVTKPLLPELILNRLMVKNDALGFRAVSNACTKPLSKIIDSSGE